MKKRGKLRISLVLLVFLYFSNNLIAQKHPLREVLQHYRQKNEMEKFQAALFLIKNISIHKSIELDWYATDDKKVNFSEFNYDNYLQGLSYLKSIDATQRRNTISDLEQISKEYLIKNIDDAFDLWKNNSWSKDYSFENFCEYILPYKGSVEPFEENWREVWQEYLSLVIKRNKEREEKDPVIVCNEILSELQDFKFTLHKKDFQPVLNSSQMMYRREGSCNDLTNMAILATRSIGIATSLDYAIHYPASSGRHFWNTIINEEGEHIPFDSNQNGDPYIYDPAFRRLGKVVRRSQRIIKQT